MEVTSQPLSPESFSYRWLVVDPKPGSESRSSSLRALLDVSDEGSFIEMDPRSPPSKRFRRINFNSQDFKFDFPILQSLVSLVPADKVFAEGFLLPLFIDPSSTEAFEYSESQPGIHPTKHVVSDGMSQISSTSSRRRNQRMSVSRRLFCKYLYCLRQIYRIIIRGSARKARAIKSSSHLADDSPKMSCAYSTDSEIYEAVLHCKRSIGTP